MARDFRAKQLRTSVIIGSGSIETTKPYLGLAFYSSSKASDFNGTRNTGGSVASDSTKLNLAGSTAAAIGTDVWCLFDGQSAGNGSMTTQRANGSAVLFLGDVVISGSLFAERTMIEVDSTTGGDLRTPNGSNAYFDINFAGGGAEILAGGEAKFAASVRSPVIKNVDADLTVQTVTSGDVVVKPAGGDVKFHDGTNNIFNFNVAEPAFTIYDDQDTGDLFSITVAQHGATTITTLDDDAAAADLTFDVDGDIILDPDGGDVSFKDAGTQFIKFTSANSATDVEISNGAADGDIIFKDAGGNEVFRMDGGEETLKIASGKKVQFADAGEFIFGDGTDIHFGVGSGGDINIPADIGLTFGHATGQKIEGDGTNITVNSGASIKLDGAGAVLTRATGIHLGNNAMNGVAGLTGADSKIRIFVATGSLNRSTNASDPFDQTAAGTTAGISSGVLVISNRRALTGGGEGNGGIKFDGSVDIGSMTASNLTVTGDLEVQGTTTTLGTTNLLVKDPIAIFGSGSTSANSQGGIAVVSGSNTAHNAMVFGRVANDTWGVGRKDVGEDNDTATLADMTLTNMRAAKFEVGGATNYISVDTNELLLGAAQKVRIANGGTAELKLSKESSSISTNDVLGALTFGGDENSAGFETGAVIKAFARENWDPAESPDHCATSLEFYTRPTNDNGIRFRMVIDEDGKVGIGRTDPQAVLDVLHSSVAQQRWSFDGNNYAQLQVAANGETTLSTIDADAFLGHLNFDVKGNIRLDSAVGIFEFQHGGTNYLTVTRDTSSPAGAVLRPSISNEDLIFEEDGGNEIARFDSSAESLLMASGKKIEFADAGESIHGDGNDLIISSGRHVTLAGASAQLNFNADTQKIYLDGNDIKFRDGVQTTAKSLSDLASVAPADGVLLSATGPNRAKSLGGMAISSRDKYVNEANIFANSTPNPSDLFFYVGDDAGSRLNSAFKNNVAVSGSISMVDTSDALSTTKFTQTSDNFILSMNTSTAAAPGSFHNILTIEPAIGLKLGTTAGSGNAGLYFQGAALNLRKQSAPLTVGGSSVDCIQAQGHIIPQADITFNLGTEALRFANLYTGDLHLNNTGSSNDVDGTSGNWTIQEGEDNLFVINNLTGKKFKMMLQPVEDGE